MLASGIRNSDEGRSNSMLSKKKKILRPFIHAEPSNQLNWRNIIYHKQKNIIIILYHLYNDFLLPSNTRHCTCACRYTMYTAEYMRFSLETKHIHKYTHTNDMYTQCHGCRCSFFNRHYENILTRDKRKHTQRRGSMAQELTRMLTCSSKVYFILKTQL